MRRVYRVLLVVLALGLVSQTIMSFPLFPFHFQLVHNSYATTGPFNAVSSTAAASVANDEQGKIFWDQTDGLYWMFGFITSSGSGGFKCQTSQNGAVWSSAISISLASNSAVQVSVYYNSSSNVVYYAYVNATSIGMRYGVLSSSGCSSISWSISETVQAEPYTAGSKRLNIWAIQNNLVWLCQIGQDGNNNYHVVAFKVTSGPTWTNVKDINTSSTSIPVCFMHAGTTDTNAALFYQNTAISGAINALKTGNTGTSWAGPATSPDHGTMGVTSYTGIGDNVYTGLVFQGGGNGHFFSIDNYTFATGTWHSQLVRTPFSDTLQYYNGTSINVFNTNSLIFSFETYNGTIADIISTNKGSTWGNTNRVFSGVVWHQGVAVTTASYVGELGDLGSTHKVPVLLMSGTNAQSSEQIKFADLNFTATVTAPVKISMVNSAPSKTVTVQGCGVSPTSISSNTTVFNLTVTPFCSFSLNFTNSGSTRNGFNSAGLFSSSINETSCGIGVCSEVDLNGYLQELVTMSGTGSATISFTSAGVGTTATNSSYADYKTDVTAVGIVTHDWGNIIQPEFLYQLAPQGIQIYTTALASNVTLSGALSFTLGSSVPALLFVPQTALTVTTVIADNVVVTSSCPSSSGAVTCSVSGINWILNSLPPASSAPQGGGGGGPLGSNSANNSSGIFVPANLTIGQVNISAVLPPVFSTDSGAFAAIGVFAVIGLVIGSAAFVDASKDKKKSKLQKRIEIVKGRVATKQFSYSSRQGTSKGNYNYEGKTENNTYKYRRFNE